MTRGSALRVTLVDRSQARKAQQSEHVFEVMTNRFVAHQHPHCDATRVATPSPVFERCSPIIELIR